MKWPPLLPPRPPPQLQIQWSSQSSSEYSDTTGMDIRKQNKTLFLLLLLIYFTVFTVYLILFLHLILKLFQDAVFNKI